MSSKRRARVVWLLTGLILVVALAACQDEQRGGEPEATAAVQIETGGEAVWTQSVATLLVTQGAATVESAEASQEVTPLSEPAPVRPGDKITMSADGEGLLTFFEGAQTQLSPGTQLEITTFEVSGESVQIDLNLLAGQTFNSISRALDADSRHQITTPVAAISVRGTEYFVFVRSNTLTQVATTEGEVEVQAGENRATVEASYGLTVQPDQTMGQVVVWSQANVVVSAPVEAIPALPVIFTRTENGQTFRYRLGDKMPLPLATFDLDVQSPGPARVTGIDFPQDTPPNTVIDVPVTLGAIRLEVLDEGGAPVTDSVLLTFEQDDLSGTARAVSGDTLLVGLGDWTLTAALESAPGATQTVEFTAVEDEVVPIRLNVAEFGGER